MTEQNNTNPEKIDRPKAMTFDHMAFAKLVVNDLSKSREGRRMLKKYKQSEVRDIIENFKLPKNQEKLREISNILFAKSPQYQRLLFYLSGMALFAHIIAPIKDIRKANKSKVLKQYTQIGELLKLMNLRHEMTKVLKVAFREDTFFGYVHRDKKSFYIQHIDANICEITSIEDGVFNYSINMRHFEQDETRLALYGKEIQTKYAQWKRRKGTNSKIDSYVELSPQNTICIKINEDMLETFPPFAGSFDAIFDIEGFKQLRKDKEELSNYMVLTQELPMRKDSDNNNDFMIDEQMMRFFHDMASDTVPENVGVITSPMKIEPIKFEKDRADNDGVAKAERDLWSGLGVSQLLFNADKSTSQGLLMSIKTDEEIVFGVLTQIQRWVNRYLRFEFADLMFNAQILHVTHFNRQEMYKMYLETAQYGEPVKNHLSAVIGLDPIETMNMAYLENNLLKMHEEFIPLMSSHTMGAEGVAGVQNAEDGRPKKDATQVSDETARGQDKPNA
ncbi:portal protein [Bacillus phage PBC2]|uniref:Putative structural protein n=1 Tax=Bacillus phage PBC2 TaxID=1675029 RepID=A0A218KCB9_9CAUD|nr:portal protein [Bacillus phage PBC2]AKQ08537.1 putative structural protein [Bacillus phage PBC2]